MQAKFYRQIGDEGLLDKQKRIVEAGKTENDCGETNSFDG